MNQPVLNSGERSRIRLYFLDLRIRYALVVLLLGLILVETRLGKAMVFVGLLWLGVALLLVAKRPSDQEMDELLAGDLQSLIPRALRSLGPQEIMAAPLALFAPAESWVQNHSPFVRRRVGRDGSSRAPVNLGVVVVPTEDQLGVYSCQYDSLNGEATQIAVEEHHYRDVVAVRLEEDVEVARASGQPPERITRRPTQVFSLEFNNGRRLCVPVSVAWQEGLFSGEEPLPTRLEKTVLAIRALMRDQR